MGAVDAKSPKANLIGRNAKKKQNTRARLLEAAHDIMSTVGVDDAKIKDITDAADVGFGTFYNYFESKDALAAEVLDCMIRDLGVRNTEATRSLVDTDPASVMPTSVRLFIREAAQTPIWRWWALRPDLLVDRVREGFAEFAKRDLRQGVELGLLRLSLQDLDQSWALTCWMMVGGVHDIVVGDRPFESETFVAEAIARAWGYDFDVARRVSKLQLPASGPAKIDWTYKLV
jgi:AcrR family transcriptional regulator